MRIPLDQLRRELEPTRQLLKSIRWKTGNGKAEFMARITKVKMDVELLNEELLHAVKLQEQIEMLGVKLKSKRAAIRQIMESADLNRYAAPYGAEALLIESTSMRWNPERLLALLKPKQRDELLPRVPAASKLKKALESGAIPGLDECHTDTKTRRLAIRAPKV